jgi:threonine dehydrogenase-like Zn-dependent dehydrogenase
MSATMRAAVASAGPAIEVRELPRPDPGPDEVRVAVRACGICGSDIHLFGAGAFRPGHTPGHEMAGVVDALGPGVRGPAPGTPVAVEPFRACGRCAACRRGFDPLCREARLLGVHAAGGLAEYVVAPAARLFAAPAPLPPPVLALAEPLAVAVHGLRRGGLERGQRVLVLGAGSVGLLTLFAARALGAGEVVATARYPHQAAQARALGAARVLDAAEATPEALAELSREDAIDLAVETVGGRADTIAHAAGAVRPGGAVVVLGVFTAPVTLDTMPLLLKELRLVWSYCYHRPPGAAPDFADAVALLARDPAAAERLVSHAVPLAEIGRAFALAADRRAGALKVSVVP